MSLWVAKAEVDCRTAVLDSVFGHIPSGTRPRTDVPSRQMPDPDAETVGEEEDMWGCLFRGYLLFWWLKRNETHHSFYAFVYPLLFWRGSHKEHPFVNGREV